MLFHFRMLSAYEMWCLISIASFECMRIPSGLKFCWVARNIFETNSQTCCCHFCNLCAFSSKTCVQKIRKRHVQFVLRRDLVLQAFLVCQSSIERKNSRVDLLLACCVFSCLLISFWSSMLFIPDTPNLTAQRHSLFSLLHTLYFLGPGLDSVFPAQLQVLNVDWKHE